MIKFVPGQRWINNAEPNLGLGTIIEVEGRTVTLAFIASEETRVYSIQTTPLSRVEFKPGDTINVQDLGEVLVEKVEQENDLLIYTGKDKKGQTVTASETRLDHFLKLLRPTERLYSGQLDKNVWFELRSQTLKNLNHISHSSYYGLSGSRTSLLPHQLYIAHEVGKRFAPRVLLSDEVGLGKTIEAGMILHQQLLREHVSRVLVVVPETLQHQWLVEMLRRFNLRFSLFDDERFADAYEMEPEANPLQASQLVIVSLGFLTRKQEHFQAALDGEWDMLIVDEAHHLQWNSESPDPAYEAIEQLVEKIKAVLLLTATPEQLGKESHFARLRLLDKNRFNDYDAFLKEEAEYEPVATIIEELLETDKLTQEQVNTLSKLIKDDSLNELLSASDVSEEDKQKLIYHLLDHQGTGRILFRNTRSAIQGFPERLVYGYSLDKPESYEKNYLSDVLSVENWSETDPRLPWLYDFIKQHKGQKALLICSTAEVALDISQYLRVKHGVHAPVFHEGMSILERDRAAAYFADEEEGSQLLVCSEIGGEGRNFQFASHLILFDLPNNPDLLEQRIGRVDRIGQGDEIFIHAPYVENSEQETLYRWYYEGLEAFQAPCPAGSSVYQSYRDELLSVLESGNNIDELIEATIQKRIEVNQQLQQGRDKLLEMNSFRANVAEEILATVNGSQNKIGLNNYMNLVFDCFGVNAESHSATSTVLTPSETMVETFPCLPDDGVTITYDRATALKYEDMQFISWEHEMVVSSIDNVLQNERGNVAMTSFSHRATTEGLVLLECLFVLDVPQEASAYFEDNLIRTVIGEDMRDYSKVLLPEVIAETQEYVKIEIGRQIIKAKKPELEKLVKICQKQANKALEGLAETTKKNAADVLLSESERLKTLQKRNPNIRDEEIAYFDDKYAMVEKVLAEPSLRLDAVRVLMAT